MRTAAREADSRSTLSPESGMWVATAARHASHYYLKPGPHLVRTRESLLLEHVPRNIAILPNHERLSSPLSRLIAIIVLSMPPSCVFISRSLQSL